ncbi:hypothetical protein C0J52_17241 [Blattella germanica]|nr:hypothetical protein C0J52_17241 [Blattella germanica]
MSALILRTLNRSFNKKQFNNGIQKLCLMQCENTKYHNLSFKTYQSYKSKNTSLVNYAKAVYYSTRITQESSNLDSSKEYKMFYKFPYIQIGGIVNKLKKWFTIAIFAGSPVAVGLKSLDIISSDTVSVFLALGGATCITLYSAGIVFYKLVGSIYLSTDGSMVKVSHLDFWGRRVDTFCATTDVVPLSDLAENSTDPYVNFRQYSNPSKLRLTVRFGRIIDDHLFTQVFGKEF